MAFRRSKVGSVDPVHTPPIEPASVFSIIDVCTDPDLFAPWFKDRESWAAWFCFLKVMFALPLDETELALFRQCTGRSSPSALGYLETSLVIGRRGGKSLILALIAAYLACFYNWAPYLTGGERGVVMVIAGDRRTASVIFRFVKAFLAIKPLAGMIDRETADTLDLNNGVTIEIQTASFRTIRGRTVLAALCDELAFWRDETSANPDTEIIAALRPAMATIPRAMMLKASSPYSRRGVLWNDHRKNFGRDDSSVLVWQADTRTMNPSVPQSVVDAAYENDPADAAAEYGAQFRSDIEAFVTREAAEACIVDGRFELPPMENVYYSAFVDPSGGSNDSMSMAICHREGNLAILDCIREVKPPFSPESVVAEFATLLKTYHINAVIGDRYAGLWPRERFQLHGIQYNAAAKPKSDLYRDFLPAVNGRRVELLDHPKLISQLCSLERRTWRGGRDSIDHPPNQHDDVVNSVAGALTNLIVVEAPQARFGFYNSDGITMLHQNSQGEWVRDPLADFRRDGGAGSVYASAPPEWWAARGVFHPHDRRRYIDAGIYRPPEIKEKSS
jgi:hypothetical protein